MTQFLIDNSKLQEYIYFLSVKVPTYIVGKIRGNLIRTHWGRGLNNFGDCLSPLILKHYGFTPVYAQVKDSDIILAGTILQWIQKDYKGIILGSGADNVKLTFPKAKILAVRGKLTKSNIQNYNGDLILGDPGLIMNFVLPNHIKKRNEIGIIPHFVDQNCDIVHLWEEKFGDRCKIINVLHPVKKVINEIKACNYILSSSLHGLVIADAFSIPNARFVNRKTMPTRFYDYKFHDYYSSIDSELVTIEANGSESYEYLISQMNLHSEKVKEVQMQLNNLFRELKHHMGK
jgi:pyruvyltransferase